MARKSEAQEPAKMPTMISIAEGCMISRRGRYALQAMIQRGEVRGAYDPKRGTSAGRWLVSREDCEKIRAKEDALRAATAAI
jgi:hypothetical protein